MSERIPAAILAGGRSSRLGGGDKCLLRLGTITVLDHVIAALAPQAGEILINTNSDPALFASFGVATRADVVPGRLGPLAGLLTALEWAQEKHASRVFTVPGDTPFLPRDFAARLFAARAGERVVVASAAGRIYPLAGFWPSALAAPLKDAIAGGCRRVFEWIETLSYTVAEFETDEGDPFFNVNTPEDIKRADARVRGAGAYFMM